MEYTIDIVNVSLMLAIEPSPYSVGCVRSVIWESQWSVWPGVSMAPLSCISKNNMTHPSGCVSSRGNSNAIGKTSLPFDSFLCKSKKVNETNDNYTIRWQDIGVNASSYTLWAKSVNAVNSGNNGNTIVRVINKCIASPTDALNLNITFLAMLCP